MARQVPEKSRGKEWWPIRREAAVEAVGRLNQPASSATEVRNLFRRERAARKKLTEALSQDSEWADAVKGLKRRQKALPDSSVAALFRLTSELQKLAQGKVEHPLTEIRRCLAQRDLAIALVRFRSLLAWEADLWASRVNQMMCDKASRLAAEYRRSSSTVFPSRQEFPRLLDIYARRQVPWTLLPSIEMTVALMISETMSALNAGAVSYLVQERTSAFFYPALLTADIPELLQVAFSDVADEVRETVITSSEAENRVDLKEEVRLIRTLNAFWGYLTGRGNLFFGLCWTCGSFFLRKKPAKTCTPSCRKALERRNDPDSRPKPCLGLTRLHPIGAKTPTERRPAATE